MEDIDLKKEDREFLLSLKEKKINRNKLNTYNKKFDIINGDCLELMKDIPDNSVDLILTDPPYGTIKGFTNNKGNFKNGCHWDVIIDTKEMYKQCERILKPNGRLILFSQQPYTTELLSNIPAGLNYNQTAIWLKNNSGNAFNARNSLLNYYEDINIFNKKYGLLNYENEVIEYFNNIKEYTKLTSKKWKNIYNNNKIDHSFRSSYQFHICTKETYEILINDFNLKEMEGFIEYDLLNLKNKEIKNKFEKTFNLFGEKSKKNIFKYKKPSSSLHPTQKPIDLLNDLIRTYSNKRDVVLDFAMGSGSTGIACLETERNFIGIELDENYFNIAKDRLYSFYII